MRTLREIIANAGERRTAVGHFNVGNLEQFKAVARAARKLNLPVIVGVSEGEREYFGPHHLKDLVASYNAEHATESFRVYLNADHTRSLEKVRDAARLGFDAIIFDGAAFPIERNIEMTREAVALAKRTFPDALVEGELGYIGSGSEVLETVPEGAAITEKDFTTPEDAARFVKETGVDMLAPAVGNIHGMLKGVPNPRLDIPRVKAIREAAGVPLVLHGGSGITDEDFMASIDAGISIVHISTELRIAWRKEMESSLAEHPDEVAPYKVLSEVVTAMELVVERRLRFFSRLNS